MMMVEEQQRQEVVDALVLVLLAAAGVQRRKGRWRWKATTRVLVGETAVFVHHDPNQSGKALAQRLERDNEN